METIDRMFRYGISSRNMKVARSVGAFMEYGNKISETLPFGVTRERQFYWAAKDRSHSFRFYRGVKPHVSE